MDLSFFKNASGPFSGLSTLWASKPAAAPAASVDPLAINVPTQNTIAAGGQVALSPTGATPAPNNNILGMTPDNFSAMVGGLGASISKPNSWQASLGKFASGLGNAHLAQAALKNQIAAQSARINEFLKQSPSTAAALAAMFGQSGMPAPDADKIGITAENPK